MGKVAENTVEEICEGAVEHAKISDHQIETLLLLMVPYLRIKYLHEQLLFVSRKSQIVPSMDGMVEFRGKGVQDISAHPVGIFCFSCPKYFNVA